MPAYQFILAMMMASYVGCSRLHHMRFLKREPKLTGISLCFGPAAVNLQAHPRLSARHVAGHLLQQRCRRQRVWNAANVNGAPRF